MTLPRLQLSVIGDEIGPTLDEMISFAHEHGLKHLDMRTVGGRNLLAMKPDEVIHISRTLEKAGIAVPAFVSPVYKWLPEGVAGHADKVDFAFHPSQCPEEEILAHAMQIAVILGAPHLRIFSYLRYDGFRREHTLSDEFKKFYGQASHYDVTLQLENEPVCNVGTIGDLAEYFRWYEQMRHLAESEDEFEQRPAGEEEQYLRPLVDIANAYAAGERPSDADIATLAPLATAIHLKDRDLKTGRAVPFGEGDVPWADELRRLLSQATAPEILASIETHCPDDSRAATARALAGFRRIAAEIGVEVV
jgi:sugar phosphate isomerase/epimerase